MPTADSRDGRRGKQPWSVITTPVSADDVKLATEKLRPYWDEWAKAHGPEAIEVLGKIRAAVGR